MSVSRVVITDYLQESTVETPILAEYAHHHPGPRSTEAELAPHLADADILIVFHDIPASARPRWTPPAGVVGSSAPVSVTTTWTSAKPAVAESSSATCPTTAPRKWPTTP
ncbi:MAG: hypothetical protein U0800_14795 [Isosphaeraceae bacterium]